MVVAKKFVLQKHFQGEPKPTDFSIVEEELPPIKNGEFLVEAEYLSVDPYMRKVSDQLVLGTTMIGSQVARIIESRNPDYPVGGHIVGYMGWRSRTVMHPDNFADHSYTGREPYLVPDFGDLSPSLALGALGQPGLTAYFGFTELCKPTAGETLVVSGAAGAVGSLVGQMAKLHGLKTIGITGADDKREWLREIRGFDHVINYKTENVAEELRKAAPQGVDCYFDNVGGEISSTVLYQMNTYGRVVVCGSISAYNHDPADLPKCTIVQTPIVSKQLTIQGFLVSRWKDRKNEAFEQIYSWIRDGKLHYRETISVGFEQMAGAFIGMLRGENIGKAIIKA